MLSRELGRVVSAWLGLRWDNARWFESAPVSWLWFVCVLARKDAIYSDGLDVSVWLG